MTITIYGVCGRCGQRLAIKNNDKFITHTCIGVPFASHADYIRAMIKAGVLR